MTNADKAELRRLIMDETDEQIAEMHSDHPVWSIERWRRERQSNETDLEYVDWRADKRWCSAMCVK